MNVKMQTSLFPFFAIIVRLVNPDAHRSRTDKSTVFEKAKMSESQSAYVQRLHYAWYLQALNSLFGAEARQLYLKMTSREKKAFITCLDLIDDEFDVQSGAKCIVQALDGQLAKPKILKRSRIWKLKANLRKPTKLRRTESLKFNTTKTMKIHWHRFYYYRNSHRRHRRNVHRFYEKEDEDFDGLLKESKRPQLPIKTMTSAPRLLLRNDAEQMSPIGSLARIATSFVQVANAPDAQIKPIPRNSILQRVEELKGQVDTFHNSQKYKKRMLDVVLADDSQHLYRRKRKRSDKLRQFFPKSDEGIFKQVFGLIEAVSKNSKDVNLKLLSPKLASILPVPYTSNILSPNILPLYNDDTSNSIASIPKMLEASGMGHGDRDSILELVMELSGANRVIDGAVKILANAKTWGIEEEVLDVTSFMKKTFNSLEKSLTGRQKRDLQSKHFAFMNSEQMEQFYGPGFLNLSSYPIAEYAQIAKSSNAQRQLLHACIRHYANGGGSKQNGTDLLATKNSAVHHRNKRADFYAIEIGEPIVIGNITIPNFKITFLTPVMMSLIAFSPIQNQFIVLGPAIMSPILFSPNLFAPFMLSPLILSPAIGPPLILSPYMLSPLVMSATVFAPYVLSPYFLSPNVLQPYIMSPLILSPYILSADVISPTFVGGIILSPYTMSPTLFTESALTIDLLSPSFLSRK